MENPNFKYTIRISYLYGHDEKDWDEVEIIAENDEIALKKAREHRRWIYKVEILNKEDNREIKEM